MRTKTILIIAATAAITALAACSPKPAAGTSAAASTAAASAMAGTSMAGMSMAPAPAKTGHGVGEITAIDTRAGTVTIKHEAIPDVGWPAMTMTFTATPPSILDGHKVGEKISFALSLTESGADVTSISAR